MAPTALTQQIPSLLPYLQSREGAERLKLSLLRDEPCGEERAYPFRLLDDSPPYARLLEGSFRSDAGTTLKDVLLLVEKDRYSSGADGFRRVSNAQLDQAWQDLFAGQRSREEALLLSGQQDREGKLVRQAPLFFCRKRRLFFHPVCPSCGLDLSLCTDDDFLRSAGLTPYASSAKRYLYCRPCCTLGVQELYLYERDHGDPLSMKDRWSLIESFGKVEEVMDPEGTFPCVRCGERQECFGPQAQARIRVTPFSFYPFYLVLSESPSLHGSDFLALLSGAQPPELETMLDPLTEEGRIGRLRENRLASAAMTFCAPGDDRLFLEILFLKLSFLNEVMRRSLAGPQRPARVASDRIWVRLAPLGKDLPLLWNFSVSVLDGVDPRGAVSLASGEFSHLGLVWFETLILNKEVTSGELLHAVADRLALRQEAAGGKLDQFLVPRHLFWNPGRAVVRQEWLPYWQRAKSLGLDLLDGVGTEGGAFSRDAFLAAVTELLRELKEILLSATPPPAQAPAHLQEHEEHGEEAMLRGVVASLIEKCRSEVSHAASAPARPEPDEYETATVIIDSRALERAMPPAPDQGEMETVIPSPSSPGRVAAPAADEAITETIILAPKREEALLETVLMRSPQQAFPPKGADEGIPETVVLDATKVSPRPPATESAPPTLAGEEEQLAETVVLQPHQYHPKGFPR